MIDFRLYRISLLPAIAAFVSMMFSLEGIPEPQSPQIAPATFDGETAQDNVRQILQAGPERQPGSDGDQAVADLVLERFEEIEAGTAATQTFEADVDGDTQELTNVVVTLPGESDETILVTAARDSASGPGAASSAAATAALIELAETLGGTEHAKTLVMVSTDAGTEGAEGARQFVEGYRERDRIQSAIVLAQPGFANPRPPHVLRHSVDDGSTSMGLVRTAEETLSEGSDRDPGERGFLADLSRLAIPTAAGEQSVLIAEGLDAIAISSAGEPPLAPADDTEQDLDYEVLAEFGGGPRHDPGTRPAGGTPGARARHLRRVLRQPHPRVGPFRPRPLAHPPGRRRGPRRGRPRGPPPGRRGPRAGAGLRPGPAPGRRARAGPSARGRGGGGGPRVPVRSGEFTVGLSEALLLGVLLVLVAGGYILSGLARSPRHPRREALAPALGAAAVTGSLGLWLLNPYLALLLAPATHVWLLGDRPRSRALVALAAVASVIPVALAVRSSAGAVGAGPWDLVLMVVDGQLSAPVLLAGCLLAGSLVGLLVVLRDSREIRTNNREPLGSRPQPGWGPPGEGQATASIDPVPPPADV